jgi:hypothetical protein
MKTFKYFYLSDSKKEALGFVTARDLNEAYDIACIKKKMNLNNFKSLFVVQESR